MFNAPFLLLFLFFSSTIFGAEESCSKALEQLRCISSKLKSVSYIAEIQVDFSDEYLKKRTQAENPVFFVNYAGDREKFYIHLKRTTHSKVDLEWKTAYDGKSTQLIDLKTENGLFNISDGKTALSPVFAYMDCLFSPLSFLKENKEDNDPSIFSVNTIFDSNRWDEIIKKSSLTTGSSDKKLVILMSFENKSQQKVFMEEIDGVYFPLKITRFTNSENPSSEYETTEMGKFIVSNSFFYYPKKSKYTLYDSAGVRIRTDIREIKNIQYNQEVPEDSFYIDPSLASQIWSPELNKWMRVAE